MKPNKFVDDNPIAFEFITDFNPEPEVDEEGNPIDAQKQSMAFPKDGFTTTDALDKELMGIMESVNVDVMKALQGADYFRSTPPNKQDGAFKLNWNCPDAEKTGSGPGSCSGGEHENIAMFPRSKNDSGKALDFYSRLWKIDSPEIYDLIKEKVEGSASYSLFNKFSDKWLRGVDPEAREDAISVVQGDKLLHSYLLHEHFGLDIPEKVTLYRVGPNLPGGTNSFFPNREVAESYQKRMDMESIHEYEVPTNEVIPSLSGAGEIWVPGDVDPEDIKEKEPVKQNKNPYHDAQGHWTSKAKAVGIGLGGLAPDLGSTGFVDRGNIDPSAIGVTDAPSAGSADFSLPTMVTDRMFVPETMVKISTPPTANSPGCSVSVPPGSEALARNVVAMYNSLPAILKGIQPSEFFFTSSHNPQDAQMAANYKMASFDSAGTWVATGPNTGYTVFWGDGKGPRAEGIGPLAHELAHRLDGDQFSQSSSDKYLRAIKADDKLIAAAQGNKPLIDAKTGKELHYYVDTYAGDSKKAFEGQSRQYSEDFAEAVNGYVSQKESFAKVFPNRTKYLDTLFGQKQNATVKLNTNCPDSEKIGEGPGSCGGKGYEKKDRAGPTPATSIKMAEREILSNVANHVEIGKGANLGVVNEVTKCLYERLNQYPHLFTKGPDGSPKLMTLKFGNTHGAGAQNVWGTTQINISTGKNFNTLDKWKGLVSENKYYAEHSGSGKMWTSNGYVSPEDSLKSSVDHEIGHIAHYYMTSDEGSAWVKAVRAATSDLDKTWKCPTAYALKNGKELFAEMFALHVNGRSDLVHPEMNKVIDSILHSKARTQ